jgi:very-short-patch-repair endonuclease
VVAVARMQHGVITRAQLTAIGFSEAGIDSRVKRGTLRVVHRGVYLLDSVRPELAIEMAAVLACGEGAFASHYSALMLLGLSSHRPTLPQVSVIGRDIDRRGIETHTVKRIPRDEVTEAHGIPVTTATRTILDLAARSSDLERLLAEAYAKRLTTRSKLITLGARFPSRPGIPKLLQLLDAEPQRTRSNPERALLTLIRKARLPPPKANEKLHGWEVDFLWADHRLIVEVDALSTHTSPRDFERDRRKDAELTLLGYTVIRVTRRQIEEEPEAVVARIAAALSLSSSPQWRPIAQP